MVCNCFNRSVTMWELLRSAASQLSHGMFILTGSLIVALVAAMARGDWILVAVSFFKQFGSDQSSSVGTSEEQQWNSSEPVLARSLPDQSGSVLSEYRLDNVHWVVLASLAVSYSTYFLMCGFLQYYFYVRQKHKPEEWKCQPDRWLTKENERHEILLGSMNMGMGGTVSGVLATYILNGGYTALYFHPLEKGLLYLMTSTVLVFLVQDGLGYYAHRLYHHPWMYRHLHKWHHRYHSPTPFSSTAMHPLEFLTYQTVLVGPSLLIPVYSGGFLLCLLYNYYYGVWAHSGIHMEALWPWQPPTKFHDDHHRYFHTNFGFNTRLWDWLHDTLRRTDRVYGEDIFHGWTKSKKTQ